MVLALGVTREEREVTRVGAGGAGWPTTLAAVPA